jgi:hypothetical protein
MRARFVCGMGWTLGVLGLVVSASGHLLAQPRAPEIDGGTVSAALGLLVSSVIILRSRRSK